MVEVVLMKLLLTVPAIILSCLGFCWGKEPLLHMNSRLMRVRCIFVCVCACHVVT